MSRPSSERDAQEREEQGSPEEEGMNRGTWRGRPVEQHERKQQNQGDDKERRETWARARSGLRSRSVSASCVFGRARLVPVAAVGVPVLTSTKLPVHPLHEIENESQCQNYEHRIHRTFPSIIMLRFLQSCLNPNMRKECRGAPGSRL